MLALQRLFMAHRAGAHTIEITASHLSMMSHVGAIASLINRAASADSQT
jgi:hypothetical protein